MKKIWRSTVIVLCILVLSVAYARNPAETIAPFDLTDKTGEPPYTITTDLYDKAGLQLCYPQIHGLDDKTLEQAVNDLIKENLVHRLPDTVLTASVEYQVTRHTPKMFSILYQGEVTSENGLWSTIYGITIDLETGRQMKLSDFVFIDDAFIHTVLNSTDVTASPQEYGEDKANLLAAVRNQQGYLVAHGLNYCVDDRYEDGSFMFCVMPNALLVGMSIEHAGDYALIRIPGEYDAEGRFFYTPIVPPVQEG